MEDCFRLGIGHVLQVPLPWFPGIMGLAEFFRKIVIAQVLTCKILQANQLGVVCTAFGYGSTGAEIADKLMYGSLRSSRS